MGHLIKGGVEPVADVATSSAMSGVDAVTWVAQARAEAKVLAVVLARKMAEKIIGHAVAIDRTVMGHIAAQALAAVKPSSAAVLLRVHPEDLAMLEGTRQEWLADISTKADVKLVADPSVGRYGCVVETPAGRIDARLETQLDVLERALRGVAGAT